MFIRHIIDVDVDEEISLCMSNITEGLCSPLASRVESVLHMNENPIDLYGVASSLKFYLQIVIKVSVQNGSILCFYLPHFFVFFESKNIYFHKNTHRNYN